MQPLLYGELVPWYRLVDPPADHADEARCYEEALERAILPRAETLLDLGAGAGHNAFHLKKRFRCTLVDLSEGMQGLSRDLNPECEHAIGDMRTVRLDRVFDAVLVHDAVMYMTTEEELLAAARTAFIHTRPGGAALFAPDCTKDNFRESYDAHDCDEGTRSLRFLEWMWDPDPTDDTFVTEYAFLLREHGAVRALHDRHLEGLFSQATWRRVLERVGFHFETTERPLDDGRVDEVFVCRRP
jgi:SAM-dependent methyltransferase